MRRAAAHTTRVRSRRGVALFLSIVVMVVAAAIVAGVLASSRRALRASVDVAAEARALDIAESGLATSLGAWDRTRATRMRTGDVDSATLISSNDIARVQLLRTGPLSFRLQSEGTSPGSALFGDARVRLLLDTRLLVPRTRAAAAALASALDLDDAVIDGNDASPAGWNGCPAPAAPTSGAIVPHVDSVVLSGSAAVRGSPPVVASAIATDPLSLTDLGDESWGSMTAHAEVQLASGAVVAPVPAIVSGVCVRSASSWGEPLRGPAAVAACTGVAPVVHARGDLTLAGGRGQGIVLVDGDLIVTGATHLVGLVLVRGAVRASAPLVIDGELLAGNVIRLAPGSGVQRSSCAIDRVTLGAARAAAVRGRAWVQVP